ncbi:hypothetical protein ACFQZR_24250 [Paenibacillus sp. GCM10027629]|uniref:hypothetical protein n=1 Tax=Paenibacillus sp. GCM10027629 TaxID=3273414 RepID=UPI00363EC485
MKRGLVVVILLAIVALTACRSVLNPIKGNAAIDWVDFVKINQKTYMGLHEAVLADPAAVLLDRVVGKVAFQVSDVVTNPEYRTQDGDAAFLAVGTELFEMKGYKDQSLIAAKDDRSIHGFRLYQVNDPDFQHMKFKDLEAVKVKRIEIYQDAGSNELLHKIQDGPDIQKFTDLLVAGSKTPEYVPDQTQGDSIYYQMVFYTDQVMAYKISLAYDSKHYYFSPGETHTISQEIEQFIPKRG